MKKSRKYARAGEFWTINDARTKGHKSLITKRRKSGVIEHIPTTHKEQTRRMRNIKLKENPQFDDDSDSYILPKLQYSKTSKLGKYQPNMRIKNTTDKSVVRYIKSKRKKR